MSEHESGRIRLDTCRVPQHGVPQDFYPVHDPLGDDGDPLQSPALLPRPTLSGVVIGIRSVGMLSMTDQNGGEHKIRTACHRADPESMLRRARGSPPGEDAMNIRTPCSA